MKVKQDHDGVLIRQKKCAKAILKIIHGGLSTATPMNRKERFNKDNGAEKLMKANTEA